MKLFVLLNLMFGIVYCEKILAFFFFPAVSHQNALKPIAKELSLRGHEVTLVTPNPDYNSSLSNLTEIDVSVGYEPFQFYDLTKLNRDSVYLIDLVLMGHHLYEDIIVRQLEAKGVKELLQKPADSFDLILIEGNTPAYFGLQHIFNAPLITLSSYGTGTYYHHIFGNPVHPVLYPDIFAQLSGPISNLLDKVDSLYVTLTYHLMAEYYMFPRMDKLVRPYFGLDMPYIGDMVRNASMMMLNVNPIISERRPLSANVIHYYKLHTPKIEELPQDLQEILDNSKNGVVYFSLGTNVRFQFLGENIKETLLEALGELPYTVLCKWESDHQENKPSNVILRTWFPQESILAHPNMKVFVTQGGLQSIQETIPNGIPMLVIPFLGEQPMNAKILADRGIAQVIMPKFLKKETLRDTILKLANEERYRLKAQQLRDVYMDQPQSDMDKVIWWCEYVIRHRGAKHLRSPSADISLYEYFMIDIFICFLVAIFVIYKGFSLLFVAAFGILGNIYPEAKLKKQ